MPHIVENLLIRAKTLLKPHLNQRLEQEVMALQSVGSPNFGNFGTPNLGVSKQNDIWM